MKAFMDAIENNEELKVKFDAISDKEQADQKDYSDEYIALAKECKITLTKEDFELDEGELSDEDLENVSGGKGLGGTPRGRMKFIQSHLERHKKMKSAQESSGQGTETTEDQN